MFVWPLIALVGILSAVWFLGVRKPGSIGTAEAIRQRTRDAYPEFAPGGVALDPDGTAALVADVTGTELTLHFVLGNQVVSRQLSCSLVRDITMRDAGDGRRRVTVQMHDLGCPRASFTLAAADAVEWGGRLERLVPSHVPVSKR